MLRNWTMISCCRGRPTSTACLFRKTRTFCARERGDYAREEISAALFTHTNAGSRSGGWWRTWRCSRRRRPVRSGMGGSNICRSDEIAGNCCGPSGYFNRRDGLVTGGNIGINSLRPRLGLPSPHPRERACSRCVLRRQLQIPTGQSTFHALRVVSNHGETFPLRGKKRGGCLLGVRLEKGLPVS